MKDDLARLSQITDQCATALAASDAECLAQAVAERQMVIDNLARRCASGEVYSDADRATLADLHHRSQLIETQAAALLNHYREALRATRNFRAVKAYIGNPTDLQPSLDVRR